MGGVYKGLGGVEYPGFAYDLRVDSKTGNHLIG